MELRHGKSGSMKSPKFNKSKAQDKWKIYSNSISASEYL